MYSNMKRLYLLLMVCGITGEAMAQPTATIYDIQYTTLPSGASTMDEDWIMTAGVVMAINPSQGYWIQESDTGWGGLYVVDTVNTFLVGDSIRISGEVEELFSLTKLINTSLVTFYWNVPLFDPVIFPTDTTANEKWENMLVKVMNANCTNPSAGSGQWIVDDGSGEVFIDDLLYPYSAFLDTVYNVTGILHHDLTEWKIEPRDSLDIEVVPAPPPALPSLKTIYQIQYSTAPNGDSPLDDSVIITAGIVSASASDGYWIQDSDSGWSGIFVLDIINTPIQGDSIELSGKVDENFKMTQIQDVITYTNHSSGNPVFAPNVITTDTTSIEKWEGVLVQVMSAICTNPTAGLGQWVVNDGSGDIFVDDRLFSYVATVSKSYHVTGPLDYSSSEWKIQPRYLADIVELVYVDERSIFNYYSVYPNPTTKTLNVQLNGKWAQINLIDNKGAKVISTSINDHGSIDVAHLANGIYLIEINLDGQSLMGRVIKQ